MDTPEHELISWEQNQTLASNVPKISICNPLLCHFSFLHKHVARHSDFSTSLIREKWHLLEGVMGSSRGPACCVWLNLFNDCTIITCIISRIAYTNCNFTDQCSRVSNLVSDNDDYLDVMLTSGEKGILPWRLTQQVPRKCSYVSAKLHRVSHYEIIILTLIRYTISFGCIYSEVLTEPLNKP
jgi:hypothetical protein